MSQQSRSYSDFIASKHVRAAHHGFDVPDSQINQRLFDWQRQVVRWALRVGRAALFEDCGLGKTLQQLEWASQVHQRTSGNVLLLCPLAVQWQTIREAEKFGVSTPIKVCESQADVAPGIAITNYEKIHKFDCRVFSGVVLDESSILKSQDGKTRKAIIESFARAPYRLACTATPAPNDHMELGNHAEFLGAMTRSEMLSTFFVHDGGDTSKWRLRGHAEQKFWEWMASWSVMIRKPSDIGYSDAGYELSELRIHEHLIERGIPSGHLFQVSSKTLGEQREARRDTIEQRTERMTEVLDLSSPFVVWCNLNDESTLATKRLSATEITGVDTIEHKEQSMLGFSERRINRLVTKPELAGFGMNWQHCGQCGFLGLSHSYEQFYQAIRRFHRFGRNGPVDVHIVISNSECDILANIYRKQKDADVMMAGMASAMSDWTKKEIEQPKLPSSKIYQPTKSMEVPSWLLNS